MFKYNKLMKFVATADRFAVALSATAAKLSVAASNAEMQAAALREAANRKRLYAAVDAASAASHHLDNARRAFNAETKAIAEAHPAFAARDAG